MSEHIDQAARVIERFLPPLPGRLGREQALKTARALASDGLLASAPSAAVEEAYQRGHEDGYWNGKTTDMSPSEAAAFMAPYRSRCGGCVASTDA